MKPSDRERRARVERIKAWTSGLAPNVREVVVPPRTAARQEKPQNDAATVQARRLRDENAELRAKVDGLQKALRGPSVQYPLSWGLTRAETVALSALMRHDWVSYDMFDEIVPVVCRSAGLGRGLSGLISSLRRKIARVGAWVVNLQGEGYRIDARHKANLMQALAEDRVGIAPPDAEPRADGERFRSRPTGFKFVYERRDRFRVSFDFRGKRVHAGDFDTPDEARQAGLRKWVELRAEPAPKLLEDAL